ncbi:uncharacterized protein LOC134271282 [Saccostrea cucullata]|uniref:uncharacterized protein LOC134271282 n=1 Tax=Saccostrea cuccullata TaxID=36930 RepID=UPI002ED1D308
MTTVFSLQNFVLLVIVSPVFILAGDSSCWAMNGRCQYTSEPCGRYKPGYCAGPTNRQCCVKGQDYLCQRKGVCQDINTVICRGEYTAGLCGGGLSRQCCRNSYHIPG